VVLYSFLTEIYTMWLACGQYPELVVEDVKDEIFDIVKPASPLHISLSDLSVSYSSASKMMSSNATWISEPRQQFR